MSYFSRRNEYLTEFSGHEEVSKQLRDRLAAIVRKYVDENVVIGGDSPPWSIEPEDFTHAVNQEFPGSGPYGIIDSGKFHEVFTVVEIFLNLLKKIYASRHQDGIKEVDDAFKLSGSVYKIVDGSTIELKIDSDLAEKIEVVKNILKPLPEFYGRFFQAVGNLVGRKAKPEDVVKDIYVSVEGYLKKVTGASKFGDAIKTLESDGRIIKEEKKVLEALNQFSSDSEGARHAGNSAVPNEETALWFLDTIISQLRAIDRTFSRQ